MDQISLLDIYNLSKKCHSIQKKLKRVLTAQDRSLLTLMGGIFRIDETEQI